MNQHYSYCSHTVERCHSADAPTVHKGKCRLFGVCYGVAGGLCFGGGVDGENSGPLQTDSWKRDGGRMIETGRGGARI